MTLLAYRFALDPTPAQERALRSNAGAARVAFNWGLARVKAGMDQRAAEATYGLPRRCPDCGYVVVAVLAAERVERRERRRRCVVV